MTTVHAPARDPLAWLEHPSTERAVSFRDWDGGWRRHTYDELAAFTHEAAREIAATVGDDRSRQPVVPLVMSAGPSFIAAFFGALCAGCVPCPLAPPLFRLGEDAYLEHIASILAVARPSALLTEPRLGDTIAEAARRAGVEAPVLRTVATASGAGKPGRCAGGELGLLQFTSGSTGRPRGVQVTLDNLGANIGMMESWVKLTQADSFGSWLPHYHDMGLIGATLIPVTMGLDAMFMAPEQFVADPRLWLECFGKHGATVCGSPSFGFAYVAKRLTDSDLDGLDLSGWRVAVAGAERLDAGALCRFARLAARAGFKPETFDPAYGMAEATLAVTGVPHDEVPIALDLDWTTVRFGEEVSALRTARIDDAERIGSGVGWAVECGTPLPGVSIEIVGDGGEQLPDGHLGEILIAGPAVANGYCEDGRSGSSRLDGGLIRSGDAGFRRDGRLYVLGRMADCVSLRGRNVYAEDLEAAVGTVEGVSRGRCTVFTGVESRVPAIVALVEGESGAWVERVGRRLARVARDDASVYVLRGEPGSILRTSSGKTRRRAMFDGFRDGSLGADVVWTSGGPTAVEEPRESIGTR